jgi:hypothetical protein
MSQSGGGELVESVAAALRADTADLDAYHRVLVSSIEGLLPASMVEVDYERSLSDRLAGRPGRANAIRLRLGESTLELVSRRGSLVATVAKEVRGVTLSRQEVPVAEWVRQLATYLTRSAEQSAEARAALGRLLGTE